MIAGSIPNVVTDECGCKSVPKDKPCENGERCSKNDKCEKGETCLTKVCKCKKGKEKRKKKKIMNRKIEKKTNKSVSVSALINLNALI